MKLALLLLLLPATVSAVWLDASLGVAGGVSFTGSGMQEWSVDGAMLDSRDRLGDGGLSATGSIQWELVEFDVYWVQTYAGSPAGPRRMSHHTDPEVVARGAASTLEVEPTLEYYSIRVVSQSSILHDGSFEVLPPVPSPTRYAGTFDPYLDMARPEHFPAGYPVRLTASSFDGNSRLFAFGAVATIDGETLQTGATENERAPLPSAHVLLETYRILEVQLNGSVSTHGSGWLSFADSLIGDLDGDLELRAVTGNATLNGTSLPAQADIVQAIGSFHARGNLAQSPAAWRIAGEGEFVGFNAQTVAGRRPGTAEPAMAVGIAAGLAGLGLALHLLWKLLGPAIVSRTDDPLANGVRAQIVRTLLDAPGVSVMDLARSHFLSRRAVRFHLDVLLKAEIASQYRTGKVPHFTLNSGSSRFQGSLVSAVEAFIASQSGLGKTIVGLARQQPVDYAHYRLSVGAEAAAERTFRLQCKTLADAGLLESIRVGRKRRWALKMDPEELRAHYTRAFLVRQGWWPAYEAARQGQAIDARILRTLRCLGLLPPG